MIGVIRREMCDETEIDIIPITIYQLVLLFTPQEREKKGKKKERAALTITFLSNMPWYAM